MSEEIDIQIVLEVNEDIESRLIPKTTIDFIINYEEGVLTLNDLKDNLKSFVEDEYYNYAEAVKRALKCVEIIFKHE